jgi:glycine/D-amino acid oxidase-like deaminating enzyme
MARIFPHLRDIEIDYCWGGLVGMTKDRFPRAGSVDGLYYSMGYSGHGAQLSTYMGVIMADLIGSGVNRNPLEGMDWPSVPGHFGKPWFLPVVGLYYRLLDRIQ